MCDLYQRALEYKKLNKFKWALKQSSQLVVDPNLTFLSNFIQNAKAKGAKSYEPKKNIAGWLSSLTLENKDISSSGINYQAYEKQEKSAKTDEENQTAIRVKGPKKWTEKGYEEDQPVSKPAIQTGDKITQSISSNASENKNKAKPLTIAAASAGFKKGGGITSMSSDNYAGSGSGSSFQSQNLKPIDKTAIVANKTKEDANYSEKQKLASDLFKGISGSGNKTGGTGLFAVMNVKTTGGIGSIGKTNPMNRPASINKQPVAAIDLLDINDDDDNNNNQSSKNNEPNLLMGFNKSEEKAPLNKKDNNLFANMNKKTSSTPFNRLTQKFQADQFEKYWETMPEELIEKFPSKIRTEYEFKVLTENLGIDIIEIIDNEIICAALNEKKEVVLIYGIYEQSGNMEVRIKAKTSEEMRRIMKVIKLYAI